MKATQHFVLAFNIPLNYVSKHAKLYQSYTRRLPSKEQQNIKILLHTMSKKETLVLLCFSTCLPTSPLLFNVGGLFTPDADIYVPATEVIVLDMQGNHFISQNCISRATFEPSGPTNFHCVLVSSEDTK